MIYNRDKSFFVDYEGESSAPDLWNKESRYRSISKPKDLTIRQVLSLLASLSEGVQLLQSEKKFAPIQIQLRITLGRSLNIERALIYGTTESSMSEILEVKELMQK